MTTEQLIRQYAERRRCIPAITLKQPNAARVVSDALPDGVSRLTVLNRKFDRDPVKSLFLIHAGLDTSGINSLSWPTSPVVERKLVPTDVPDLAFGSIVGAVTIRDSIAMSVVNSPCDLGRLNWVKWVWILSNPFMFNEPIPYRGERGVFFVNPAVLSAEVVHG